MRDYKDRLDMIQNEVNASTDLRGEIERLKELSKRQRVDLDVKENQVKSLRSRIHQH